MKAGLCITTDGLTMTPRPLHMRRGAGRDPACGGTSIAHWPRMGFSCPQTLVTKPSAVEDGSALHVKWGLGPDCPPHLLNMVSHGVTGCVVRMLLAVVGCGSHAGHVVSMRVHVQQSQATAVALRVDIAPAGPSEQRMVAQTRCECDPGRTRTCNRWFRRPPPYPFGTRGSTHGLPQPRRSTLLVLFCQS